MTSTNVNHRRILRDLFETLFDKFVAVLEGHRVIFEVCRWIFSVSQRLRGHERERSTFSASGFQCECDVQETGGIQDARH